MVVPVTREIVNGWPWDAEREAAAYARAIHGWQEYDAAEADVWVAGGAGSEVPVLRNGRHMLYVYNPWRDEHGWLDLSTDVVEEIE